MKFKKVIGTNFQLLISALFQCHDHNCKGCVGDTKNVLQKFFWKRLDSCESIHSSCAAWVCVAIFTTTAERGERVFHSGACECIPHQKDSRGGGGEIGSALHTPHMHITFEFPYTRP